MDDVVYQEKSEKAVETCDQFVGTVNDVIADKNVVTKIMNYSTGLQHIEYNGISNATNGFATAAVTAVTALSNRLFPCCWRFAFKPLLC